MSTGRSVRIPPRAPDPSAPQLEALACPTPPTRRSPLVVARTGEPDGRRRSRHPPPMGRRGSGRGVRDAGRASALRPADDRGAGRDSPRRQPAAGQPGRQPGAPRPGLPAELHGRLAAPRRPGRRRPTSASATDATAAASSRRSSPTSMPTRHRRRRPRARPRPTRPPSSTTSPAGWRRRGTSLTEAVGLFVAARRPFLDELTGLGRRRALDAARLAALYEDASGLLDRLLLRLIATYQEADALTWIPRSSCPALTSILALVFAVALFDQWRERRGGFQLIWTLGMVFYGVGAGCEALAAASGWNEGALPDLVPDRRRLDGRLAGARDGVPARPDAVRLQLRAVPLPGRACSRSSSATGPSTRAPGRCRCSTSSRPGCWPWPSRSRPTSPTTAGRSWRRAPSSARRSSASS